MPLTLLDSNVLVHAAYRRSALHEAAATLVDRGLREANRYCISPQNLVEFAAVVSRARFVEIALSGEEIERICKKLYESRTLKKIYPMRGTVLRAASVGASLGVTGSAWYDMFLAITMRDAGVASIITENTKDFHKFPFVSARAVAEV